MNISSVSRSFIRKFRFSSTNFNSTQASQPQVKEEKFDFEDLKVVERTERRKPPIEPFIKDVFVSKFNRDLLAYPEILNKEESEALESRISRLEKVFTDKERNENDRKNALSAASMYAAPVNLTNGGLAFNVTERLRYLETISSDLNLAKELSDHWIGLEALKLGLKADDFQTLLPELTTGQKVISLCIRETISTRVAQADFRTLAELDGQGVWRINGEKECINRNGYYLVLCAVEGGRLKAFLVHPNAEGVSFKEGFITFRSTPGIPLDNISEEALASVMGLSRLDTATLCRSSLKHAIYACIEYVRGRFVSGKPLAEISTIRKRVGESLLIVYASESAAYFTAGLLDGYESPDADIEMAMCRNFMAHHGTQSMIKLLSVPGLQQHQDFNSRLDSMRRLTSDETSDNVDMFIALNGLHHAGKILAQEIKQIRNPLLHPGYILKKVFADRFQEADDPKLTLYLAEHLHPSLRPVAEMLEYCVLRLRFACETLMGRHGSDIAAAYTELERLSQAGTEVLAMTAVLARASRAYCIGLRNGEMEMKLAACFVEKTRPRVRQLILDIDNGQYLNLDHFEVEFGRKVLDTMTMLVEKPTERVFW